MRGEETKRETEYHYIGEKREKADHYRPIGGTYTGQIYKAYGCDSGFSTIHYSLADDICTTYIVIYSIPRVGDTLMAGAARIHLLHLLMLELAKYHPTPEYLFFNGTPGKVEELRAVCKKRGALIVEDAAESFGARYLLNGKWVETGALGDFNCISFNGNKIITGSCGGMFLTDSKEDADKVRKWSTQSREAAPWYQHEEIGYNYRMSNVIAGVIRGQLPYLQEHIDQKKSIYERYKEGLKDLPVKMNPYDAEKSIPNFWLSCMIIDEEAMCQQVRDDKKALYIPESGKSCPTEILETLAKFNAEGRPIWKPMHTQPIYLSHDFINRNGSGRGQSNAYIDEGEEQDVGMDIFRRGLCLPSDNKMTVEEQDKIIEVIHRAFE